PVSTSGHRPACRLFPYTTLFRSRRAGRRSGLFRKARAPVPASLAPGAPCKRRHGRRYVTKAVGKGDGFMVVAQLEEAMARLLKGDRKSTRLNSSHVKISYAVFCL